MTRAFVCLALLALLVPGVAGQEADAEWVLEDAAGDVEAGFAGATQSPGAGTKDAVDLLGLEILETALQFVFRVHVVGSGEPAEVGYSQDLYRIELSHNGIPFRVDGVRQVGAVGRGSWATLFEFDEGQGHYRWSESLEASFDEGQSVFEVRLPRDLLADERGAPPARGRTLDEIRTTSSFFGLTGAPRSYAGVGVGSPHWSDAMPDTDAASYAVRMGLEQHGTARLFSDEPFRSSNGEASTFLFEVSAANQAEQGASFSLRAVDVPAGWDVRLPDATIDIDGETNSTIPVVLRTPFAHEHGTARSFTVEMQSQSDPGSVGRVELGIRYPAIAQPAGHHDTLYLHSAIADDSLESDLSAAVNELWQGTDWRRGVFMNTHPEVANDAAVAVEGSACDTRLLDGAAVSTSYCWWIPLQPGLELGLDFDLDRTGEISVPIGSQLAAPGTTLSGKLVHWGPSDESEGGDRTETVVADLVGTDAVDLAAGGEALLTGIIVPAAGGDYVPYARGSALALLLVVTADRPGRVLAGTDVGPEIMPGGVMVLPLDEYEDRILNRAAFAVGVTLSHEGAAERFVNPGATAVFNLTLEGRGEREEAFLIDVVGQNQEWARFTTPRTLSLEPGQTARVSVAVAAPTNALDGERADLILEATSASNSHHRALARLLATVDVDAQHPNDALLADDLAAGQDAPAPTAAFLLAALALLATRRR